MATNDDVWGKVYAKAWTDDEFRTLLETDPTAALKKFQAEMGMSGPLVPVPPPPAGANAVTQSSSTDEDQNCIHLVSCC